MKSICEKQQRAMMASIEGALDPPAQAELERHLEACPACRDEYQWLCAVSADLEAMGDAALERAPQVDIVDDVSRAAERARIVPFEQPGQAKRRSVPVLWLGLAAAAAAVLVLWVSGYRLVKPRESVTTPMHVRPPRETTPPKEAPPEPTMIATPKDFQPTKSEFEEVKRLLPDDFLLRPTDERPPGEDEPEHADALTVETVLATRRNAITDPAARVQLARWASLTEDTARDIIGSVEASREAKVGAASALPPDEAIPVLLVAVAESPDDAYLRYELAKAYEEQEGASKEAAEQRAAASDLDPQNALNQCELASSLLSLGDEEGASASLHAAAALDGAYAYTSEAARHCEQALIASGVDADTARLVAALTAGTQQYVDIVELGDQLLQFGSYYERNGDVEFAQDVYETVDYLGGQVARSATFFWENVAGVDIQRAAIDMFEGIYTTLESAEGMETLAAQLEELGKELNALLGFFDQLNEFLVTASDELLASVSGFVIQNGDLTLLEDTGPAAAG